MRKNIETNLPRGSSPTEWASMGGKTLYTASIPIYSDGTLETGDIRAQTKLTLDNLKTVLEAGGGTLDDVTQVQVILTSKEHFEGMNEVYRTYFNAPYPNRATIIAQLMIGEAAIEVIAHAHIEG